MDKEMLEELFEQVWNKSHVAMETVNLKTACQSMFVDGFFKGYQKLAEEREQEKEASE